MTDQLPMQGPEKGDCGCGCGRFGLLKKPNRAGCRCVRLCRCKSCLGTNSRRKGQTQQRKVQVALEIPGTSLGANHEENWRGLVRVEVKAGGQVAPAWNQYLRMEDQAELARAIGDTRPFIAVVAPDGVGDFVVMFRMSRMAEVVAALDYGLTKGR